MLTARHVVKDAKKIVVELHDKRTHRATVVAVDAVWDCAVLELDGSAESASNRPKSNGERRRCKRPATAWSRAATVPTAAWPAIRACFSATSVRRETPDGPDDWFEISGHARGGDSGGGVFNERGRLVGVLWGTDGQEVVCVQAGRLQKLLSAAIPEDAAQQKSILQRVPTPAKPLLPWRRKPRAATTPKTPGSSAVIELQERQAKAAVPAPPKVEPPIAEGQRAEAANDESASPALAGMVILASLTVGGAFYSFTRKKTA